MISARRLVATGRPGCAISALSGWRDVIGEILPSDVVSDYAFDDGGEAPLFPEEQRIISRAVDKRRREFAATRTCARRALSRLGAAAGPIVTGQRGEPLWPDGVIGSMTHCAGYRAAAVARPAVVAALGIDAEPNEVLPDGVLDSVSAAPERVHLSSLPTGDGVRWDRLLLCAKEAVFKAWYPITGRELTFLEADLTIDPADRSFQVRLLVAHSPFGPILPGRWSCRDGLLLTAVAPAVVSSPARSVPSRPWTRPDPH